MRMKIVLGLILLLSGSIYGQTQRVNPLNREMENYLKGKEAKVGVVVTDSVGNVVAWINGNTPFPMQSVFKFHIAMVMLAEIDQGRFTIDQKVKIKRSDLKTKTWSPIRDQYPKGTTLTIGEIIEYTVTLSDNNGCDLLLKLLGGPEVVEQFFVSRGYPNFSVKINEAQMHKSWEAQFRNWITPAESNRILIDFYHNKGPILTSTSRLFLLQTLFKTETGLNRLKGKLPEGAIVAHKTGSSGTNYKGVTAAANDIGIVILPDQTPFFISVFVSQSTENEKVNDAIIADLCVIAWDYFTNAME